MYRLFIALFLNVFPITNLCFAEYPVRENETIRKSFSFLKSDTKNRLEIDNVFGSIEIKGYTGDKIEATINKTIKAKTKHDIDIAKEEVTLDFYDNDDSIEFIVNGPFRKADGSINFHGPQRYQVHYDFEIKVPHQTSLYLSTINDGEIYVNDTIGDFDIKNINGGVEIENINGSGSAYALNKDLIVVFKENPKESSYFGSLNGDVDISFQKGFSADCMVKTFNGDIYSDFPIEYLARPAGRQENRKGKFVYKSNGYTAVRVGSGGPQIEFDGFNGDIRINEIHTK